MFRGSLRIRCWVVDTFFLLNPGSHNVSIVRRPTCRKHPPNELFFLLLRRCLRVANFQEPHTSAPLCN